MSKEPLRPYGPIPPADMERVNKFLTMVDAQLDAVRAEGRKEMTIPQEEVLLGEFKKLFPINPIDPKYHDVTLPLDPVIQKQILDARAAQNALINSVWERDPEEKDILLTDASRFYDGRVNVYILKAEREARFIGAAPDHGKYFHVN